MDVITKATVLERFANLPDPFREPIFGELRELTEEQRSVVKEFRRGQVPMEKFVAAYKLMERCTECGKPRSRHAYKKKHLGSHRFKRKESLALFWEKFGSLYPGLDLAGHVGYIWFFRAAWKGKTETDQLAAGDFIADVYNRRGTTPKSNDPTHPNYRPLLTVDFSAGKLGIRPRTLLDRLAVCLMNCRKNLAICEYEECGRYFVKSYGHHGRYRFCSAICFHEERNKRKRESYHNASRVARQDSAGPKTSVSGGRQPAQSAACA